MEEVPPQIDHEIQEEDQQVPQDGDHEIQEQQEQDQQVPQDGNLEIQEQDLQVPQNGNYEIQEQQEQDQQEVPPQISHETQEQDQQVPQNGNQEVQEQDQQVQEQHEQEEQDQFPPEFVYHEATKGEFHLTNVIGTSYTNGAIKVYKTDFFLRDFKKHFEMPANLILNYAVKHVKAIPGAEDYNNLWQRAERSRTFLKYVDPHPNIMGIEAIFKDNGIFCVAFPYMRHGSLRSIIRSHFPNGIEQEYVFVVLKEALEGLFFLHENHHVHGEISSGQIFFNAHHIKLSFAATVYDDVTYQDDPHYLPVTSISKWASAPEVYDSENAELRDPKADIWMIGITALELAYGCEVKIQSRDNFMSIVDKIKKERRILPLVEVEENSSPLKRLLARVSRRVMDKPTKFDKFVCKCLHDDPAKRPTARELLDSKLFTTMKKDVNAFSKLLEECD